MSTTLPAGTPAPDPSAVTSGKRILFVSFLLIAIPTVLIVAVDRILEWLHWI